MTKSFPESGLPPLSLKAALIAVALTVVLFLLMPLSHALSVNAEPDIVVREVITTAAPPPPPIPQMSESVTRADTTFTQIKQPTQVMTLNQLALSLEPTVNDALSMGVSFEGFALDGDMIAGIEKVFTFEELVQVPHVLFAPAPDYPDTLLRRGIRKGTVEMIILIDESGAVSVESIISASHEKFKPIAMRVARGARFSVTQVDGKPVKVRGRWPLTIYAP